MSIDVLTTDRPPRVRPPTPLRNLVAVFVWPVLAAIVGVFAVFGAGERESGIVAPDADHLDVLLLGDSSAGHDGCPGCQTYVQQLAAALAGDGERSVRVDDYSWRGNAQPPSTIAALLFFLRTDPGFRDAVYGAEVIVLAVGSADVGALPPTPLCRSTRRNLCPESSAPLFAEQLTTWVAEAAHIRGARPASLRLITPLGLIPSAAGSDVSRATCAVAARHRGACVDLRRLSRTDRRVLGGGAVTGGRHLSQHGHDVVAGKLIALGLT